ncbi:related to 5-amino-6-(5-phosphoribosylamino)uracil reductase [Ramularia collo-cygni]|uniref:2,5-diamino-6-ribosylamino-4(3H)-pyrimidinone 5'-phosphate reductase n=1 Tax=Ramularia collo-cygni TaxID=112498 RepID=A0A2D3VH22_9PEZI|nr:related to 5-amino-6-(5-phosphoribosylamino)uracil reductase [Ramularia collo-cygni]CZT25335.1 related to 5-amino-6-(5-phosphoribosylamino)uracil reductase [Ramularia collo-cygni]
MSEVHELSHEDLTFLEDFMPKRIDDDANELPYTTLTWAQSLDGKIALGRGLRTQLSGVESRSMTHYLRARHDAILVGRATAEVDNPSLNCRYPGASFDDQPQPVILDMDGRWAVQGPTSKVHGLATTKQGKFPWRIGGQDVPGHTFIAAVETDRHNITTISVPKQAGRLAWRDILKAIKKQGVNSVMIEGGAQVIQDLLALPQLVDAVIITVAPTFLGSTGISISPAERRSSTGEIINAAWLENMRSRPFGNDIVTCGRLAREIPSSPGRSFDIAMR